MKRTVFINSIIRSIFIFLFLVFIFIKNKQLYSRLFIFPFILLIACYIIKDICNLFNKTKISKLFQKLSILIFSLFAIIFVIMYSYTCIKNKQYFILIFTIPFWIFFIYLVCKYLLGIKKSSKHNDKSTKFNFKIMVSCFLVVSVLLIGIVSLFFGIKGTYDTNEKTKNYILTNGYYKDYEIYDSDEVGGSNITYRLIYVYTVDGEEYSLKTDYGSGIIPDVNSERKIKYDPDNPSEALFVGINKDSILIYFGTFFVLGGMVFVLSFLYILGVFDKTKINVLGLYIGIVCIILGIGIITIQFGEGASLMSVIKQMRFWILVPIIFIATGIFQVIKCLFFERLDINNKKQIE